MGAMGTVLRNGKWCTTRKKTQPNWQHTTIIITTKILFCNHQQLYWGKLVQKIVGCGGSHHQSTLIYLLFHRNERGKKQTQVSWKAEALPLESKKKLDHSSDKIKKCKCAGRGAMSNQSSKRISWWCNFSWIHVDCWWKSNRCTTCSSDGDVNFNIELPTLKASMCCGSDASEQTFKDQPKAEANRW